MAVLLIPKSTFPVVCTVHSELRASHTKGDAHANACVELAQQPALLLMTSAIITPTARLTSPSVLPPTTAPFARCLSAPRRHVHVLLPVLPRVFLKPFLCDATVHPFYPACRLSGAAAALAGRDHRPRQASSCNALPMQLCANVYGTCHRGSSSRCSHWRHLG
jgi:hypothetical protein